MKGRFLTVCAFPARVQNVRAVVDDYNSIWVSWEESKNHPDSYHIYVHKLPETKKADPYHYRCNGHTTELCISNLPMGWYNIKIYGENFVGRSQSSSEVKIKIDIRRKIDIPWRANIKIPISEERNSASFRPTATSALVTDEKRKKLCPTALTKDVNSLLDDIEVSVRSAFELKEDDDAYQAKVAEGAVQKIKTLKEDLANEKAQNKEKSQVMNEVQDGLMNMALNLDNKLKEARQKSDRKKKEGPWSTLENLLKD